jgi:hypothetical protein
VKGALYNLGFCHAGALSLPVAGHDWCC